MRPLDNVSPYEPSLTCWRGVGGGCVLMLCEVRLGRDCEGRQVSDVSGSKDVVIFHRLSVQGRDTLFRDASFGDTSFGDTSP